MAPLPTTLPRFRRERKRKRTYAQVWKSLIIISFLCLICLAWLSTTALPSTSHDRDAELVARLQEFAGRRLNQSLNNSNRNVATKNATLKSQIQNQRAAKVRQKGTTKDLHVEHGTTTGEAEKESHKADKSVTKIRNSNVTEAQFVQAINDAVDTTIKVEELTPASTKKPPTLNLKDQKLSVKLVRKAKCAKPARPGDTVAFHFEGRVNGVRGNIYAKSNKDAPAKLTVGNVANFPPGLEMGLLGACPGELRELKIPHSLAFGDRTSSKFKIPKGASAHWRIDILEFLEDTGKDGDKDDDEAYDDDEELGESSGAKERKAISAEQSWKKAIGLLVEEEQIISTDVTTTSFKTVHVANTTHKVVNGTNTTILVNSTLKPKPVDIVKAVNTTVKVWKDIAPPPRSAGPTRLPLHPATPYLGVLVDGGRHYFPLEWLKELVDQLYMLRYNFIHLRLTDDQSFNIKLESHPQLAVPAPPTAEDSHSSNPVWTVAEMRELVKYANSKNVTIMPEINAPGHCASWGGIPGLIIPCPEFSCEKGYGVPMNETNPKLMEVISDVIREVMEIFDTSYYLHLGGDEVHMSSACYEEIGGTLPPYNRFEKDLQQVLLDLGISEDRVVRWETTGQKATDTRAGKIAQWWQTFPRNKRKEGEFFVSQGLYLDSCGERAAEEFFQHTKMLVREDPKGIIAGTFELSTHWWKDRNVFGRLLSVAMGASQEGRQLDWSPEMYVYFCEAQGWDPQVCMADGRPLLHTSEWLKKWQAHWVTWKAATCDRLTEAYDLRVMNNIGVDERGLPIADRDREVREGQDLFWDNFAEVPTKPQSNQTSLERKTLFHSAVPHLGAILDIAAFEGSDEINRTLDETVNILSKLGFNLIQLRLLDDSTFPLQLDSHPKIAWDGTVMELPSRRRYGPKMSTLSRRNVLSASEARRFVEFAEVRGIMVMPEISIVSRAGGWLSSGLVAQCPNAMCETGSGLPLDITNAPLLSVLSNVVFELRSIFSSEFLHLGYDEREESKACFDELEMSPNFDLFERKLMTLLELQGIPPESVLRWESSEDGVQNRYRAGNITHYKTLTGPPKKTETKSFWAVWMTSEETEPFFVSTGLDYDSEDNTTDAFSIYRHTRKLVKKNPIGILAKYMTGNIASWGRRNALGKMIAVAIGADADLPKMDEEMFRVVYMKTCYDLNITSCWLYGKIDNTTSTKVAAPEERVLQPKCEVLTHMETRRRPAPGVV